MKRRLRNRLFIKFAFISLVCLIIPLGVILVYTTFSSSAALENEAEESLKRIALEKNDQVHLVFELQYQISEAMVNEPTIVNFFHEVARSDEIDQEKLAELSQYLAERMNNANGLYENIFFSYEDRILVDGVGGESVGHRFDPVTEAYYYEQLDHPGVFPSDYMYSPVTGRPVIAISNSVLDRETGDVLSVFVIAVDINRLTEKLVEESGEDQFGTMILDASGLVIAADQEEHVLNLNFSENEGTKSFFDQLSHSQIGSGEFSLEGESQAAAFVKNDQYGLYILSYMPVHQYMQIVKALETGIITVSLISLIIAALVVIFSVRRMVKPIEIVTKSAQKIAEGNLRVEELHINRKDELGTLALAFNTMLYHLRWMVEQISRVAQSVHQSSKDLTEAVEGVRTGAEQIASSMEQLSSGAEEQASTSSDISGMIGDLNQQISQANQEVQALEKSSDQVYQLSAKGKEEIGQSVELMHEITNLVTLSVEKVKGLEQYSEQIYKLVEVIQAIAERTNLLALNAAIEAARAGESGRGFAVVANEVRQLAEQVEKSVQEITGIITGIQNETKSVVSSLETGYQKVKDGDRQILISRESFEVISGAVAQMNERIRGIAAHLKEVDNNSDSISHSAAQIASTSEEAAAGVEQSSAAAQQQSASMQDIAASAEALSKLSSELHDLVKQFKL